VLLVGKYDVELVLLLYLAYLVRLTLCILFKFYILPTLLRCNVHLRLLYCFEDVKSAKLANLSKGRGLALLLQSLKVVALNARAVKHHLAHIGRWWNQFAWTCIYEGSYAWACSSCRIRGLLCDHFGCGGAYWYPCWVRLRRRGVHEEKVVVLKMSISVLFKLLKFLMLFT
jgi:hypothetical protein